MKPLGIDLARLSSGEPPPVDYVPECPGASLRVTRSDLSSLQAGGERFQPMAKTIPYDGYGVARVACTNPVERLEKTTAGRAQFCGLCRDCSQLEADNHAVLRKRASP